MTRARFQLLVKAEKLPAPKAQYSWKPKKAPSSFCVVSNVSDVGSVLGIKRHLLGTTEVVPQCFSPEWATILVLEHTRGTEHRIAIDIFHSLINTADETHKIHHSERRGHLHVDNAQQLCGILLDIETILSNRDYCLTEKLSHGCTISVRLEECSSQRGEFKFHLRGLDCQNTRLNFLDRPDFIFEIRRKQRGKTQDSWALVYRSNIAKASLNPYWDESVISLETLCNGDLQRDFQISVWDTPSRTLLGYITTSIAGLMGAVSERGNAEKALDIRKPTHNLLHSASSFGKLVVLHASMPPTTTSSADGSSLHSSGHSTATPRQESLSNLPQAVAVEILSPPRNVTFEEFMQSGQCKLELCVAVDFTVANGHFQLEGTPHYRSEEQMNDYEWCMGVMAESVKRYNASPQIPLWGFGAQFHNEPCPIFQCGASRLNNGSRELLHAYQAAFHTTIEFGYETQYDKVIQAAAHHSQKQMDAAQQHGGLAYTVLLILTVGTERDILAAKERIEAVSAAPLSIVFIRIDNGKHSSPLKTTEMDPRCTLLEGNRFTKTRDAVSLAEAILKNVKPQLSNYYSSRGIYPPV